MRRLIDLVNIMRLYRRKLGRFPNLLRPRLFTEKVQLAKLLWRSPLLPLFTDKVLVKAFIADKFGADLVTPNLFAGEWLPPREDRNWPLPLVIKTNHASGGVIVVRTEADRDWNVIEVKLRKALGRVYGDRKGEWPYREVKPQVLVEPFLGDGDPPTDYKFYTFGGRVAFVSVAHGRFRALQYAVYDRDWKVLPLMMAKGRPLPASDPPASLSRMVEVAEEVGKRLPFCRVDFYDIGGQARFGEITLFPSSGFTPPDPPEYDRVMGDLFPKGRAAYTW